MTVVLTVLKIIGWILLALLALILFALCVKVRFRIEYSSENTSALLKWLFLKIKLYPRKPKEKKPKEEKPEEEEEPKEEEEEEKEDEKKPKEGGSLLKTLYDAEGIDGLYAILKKVLYYTKRFFGSSMRGVVVDELWLDVRCTKEDAAATAIYYGEVCAVLFPLLGALASKCRLKKYDFNIYPDYLARFSDASFVTSFHFTPMYFIGVTTAYVFRLLFGVLIGMFVKIFGAKKDKNSSRNENKNQKEKSEG